MLTAQLGLARPGLLALGRPFLLAGGPAPSVKGPTMTGLAADGSRAATLGDTGQRAASLADSGLRQVEVD